MSPTPTPANIFPLRARDHEYAAPAAIFWLADTTHAGLERVKGLLREYENSERRQCASQSRPPMSQQFLWDALGILR